MTPTASPMRGPRVTSRPRDDDRPTRKPLALWDRVKYLLLLAELPPRIDDPLRFVLQLVFDSLFIIIEFGALFWLLTRGGVDVYYPDDIKTRFTDVWGQDNVRARVRENMVFLEDPEAIEEKGGYVPGGILLWGPPGTGKTLMA